MSFKVEVIAYRSKEWNSNAVRLATREEAEAYGKDLECRWVLVTDRRVTESADPVNYAWIDGKLVDAKPVAV